jgi:hypothetical protein
MLRWDDLIEGGRKMADVVFEVSGHNGSITLCEDRVIIKHGGLFGVMTQGFSGAKEILLDQVTSVDYREPSLLAVGFLRVLFPGAESSRSGTDALAHDENTVLFRGGHRADFQKMKGLIDGRVKELRQARSAPVIMNKPSDADELAKFAALLEKGLITQDEYNAKKKQILGL